MKPATISSKYQVVIPREVLEQFGLTPGRKVIFVPDNGTLRDCSSLYQGGGPDAQGHEYRLP
jgi:AbrB family looped-hinge helix DNA binding protein